MRRATSVGRGITAGAAFAVGFAGVHSEGFNSERIRSTNDALTEWRSGRPSTEDEVHGVVYWIAGTALFGAAFGAVSAGATRVIALPPALVGGLSGLGVWLGAETLYRSMPGRRQRWGFPPLTKTVTTLVAYGAAVGVASRRRR